MNVPKLPFLEKKGKSEYFLSLVLRDEKANAVVFEEIQGRINVVGQHEEPFKTSLEDATQEELLDVIDKAVSTAEKTLPPDTESQKTIFGVKESWIEEGKINKDYLAKLKKVSDELEFKPVGFLVISEAIAHLLQREEGAPVSGILAEIGQKIISVSLIRAGRVVESKSSAIHDSPAFTVDTLLKHFTNSEILPSRIILYDGGEEKLQQQFITHQWSKSLPFLHVPQITNLPANFDARAVLNGAATQMGFEVLETSLLKAEKEDKEIVPPLENAPPIKEDATLGELVEENDFGFVEGKELPGKGAAPVAAAAAAPAITPETAIEASDNLKNPQLSDQFREIPEEVKLNTAGKRSLPINAALLFGALRKIPIKSPQSFAFGALKNSPKMLLLPIIPLVLLILILYIYIFARSAVITLEINSKNVTKSQDVTLAESQNSDPSINLIKAAFVDASEDGKITTTATGKKETGDKAKGVVTLFNSSDSPKTIAAGTTLTSSNDLEFVTDKEVKVASASGDAFSGTKPGTTNVNVVAAKFGTNYNLPSNTKFSLASTTSVVAKNDNAFSGGTKKDIKVVSQKDLDKLSSDLQKKLEGDARGELEKKKDPGSEILPAFTDVTFDKKSFSKKVDEEATEVSLTATVNYESMSYKRSDMTAFAKSKLTKDAGDKLTISEDDIKISAKDVKKKLNKEVSAKLDIQAGLIPEIKEGDLAKEISGKSLKDAQAKISEIPELNNSDIKLSLSIPLLPKRMPFKSSKIKVVVNKNG